MIEVISLKTEDNLNLDGILYKSDNLKDESNRKLVISIHGIKSKMFNDRNTSFKNILNEEGIDFLVFNNRGHVIVSYPQIVDGAIKLTGSTYEDFNESIYDLKAAVMYAIDYGYDEIHLNGHSFGCDKIVLFMNYLKNAYNEDNYSREMYDKIKSIALLSLVDFRYFTENFSKSEIENFINQAKDNIANGKENELIVNENFLIPLCSKEFLNLFGKDSQVMRYINYEDENFEFSFINKIDKRKFFAYGNNGELILKDANDVKKILEDKISGDKQICIINDANHSFKGFEDKLAKEYLKFITII